MVRQTEKRPIRDTFLVFGSPRIKEDEINEVIDTLRSGWLGTGPKVAHFESDFATYKGVTATQAAAVNSCTAALHLSLLAAGIGPGDEVITTPLTFCATVNAIIHAGATPVLADVDPTTMNIDPNRIEAAITPRTRAILPVHFAGRPCEMDAIMEIARRHHLRVIEDCAHAIETEYKGEKAGVIGDFGCFSFYVTKNVVTGEGGMVIARDEKDIERVKTLALHGMSRDAWKRFSDSGYKHYEVTDAGFKYNMMDIQASIGIHQLRRIEENWQRRLHVWQQYQIAFTDLNLTRPAEPDHHMRHGLHLYTLLIDEARCGISRDSFLSELTNLNIGVGVHYRSLPEYSFYHDHFDWRVKDFPNAMSIGRKTVSIPLTAALTDQDVNDVISAVRNTMGK